MATQISELILKLRDEVSASAASASGSLRQLGSAVDNLASKQEAIARQRALVDVIGGASQQSALVAHNYIGAAQGAQKLAAANEGLHISVWPVRQSLSFVAADMLNLGEGGRVASHAIAATAIESGAAGLALGALAGTMALLVSRVETAREHFRELSERELADLAKQTRGLVAEQDIRGQIKLLETQADKLREWAVKADEFRVKAAKEGAAPDLTERLLNGQFQNILKDELASISRMDAVTAINTLLRKENALAAEQQAAGSEKVIAGLKEEVAAAQQRITQLDRMEQQARGGPESEAIFQSLSQISKKIQEVVKGGFISPTEIAALKGQIEGLTQAAMEKWGLELPAAVQSGLSKVSNMIDQLAQIQNITPIQIDAEQPFRELAKIEARVQALQAMAAQPIPMTFAAEAEGSPQMPFSDYFNNYAVGVINNFAAKAAEVPLTFSTNVTDMMGSVLGQIIDAKEILARSAQPQFFSMGQVGDFSAGARGRLAALQDTLRYLEGMGTPTAAPTMSGGGGGGGNVTIVNDFRGATISHELIDRGLMPKFEQQIKAATGKQVDYRTLN